MLKHSHRSLNCPALQLKSKTHHLLPLFLVVFSMCCDRLCSFISESISLLCVLPTLQRSNSLPSHIPFLQYQVLTYIKERRGRQLTLYLLVTYSYFPTDQEYPLGPSKKNGLKSLNMFMCLPLFFSVFIEEEHVWRGPLASQGILRL